MKQLHCYYLYRKHVEGYMICYCDDDNSIVGSVRILGELGLWI